MDGQEQLSLFPPGKLNVTLLRLCHEVIERHGGFQDTVMLAIQPRGIYVGQRLQQMFKDLLPTVDILLGELDVTFFRDDFRKRDTPLEANRTHVDFLIEDKHVILVDDVLFTGRTVRAAMDAMLAYGRPRSVELLVLVDRQHERELPIEPSYSGIQVDALENQRVLVRLKEAGGDDSVTLITRD